MKNKETMSVSAPQPRTGSLVRCPREVPVCSTPSSLLSSVGCTPLVRMSRASEETGCEILAKAEYMNPGGSIKDRIARAIIEGAERRGELTPDKTILEVTSGNTGIALAMVAAARGYRTVIVMPRTVSLERRKMIEALGAELRLLDEINRIREGVQEAINESKNDPSIFLPNQFSNPDNPACHERTTGPEIILQTDAKFDAFVMGVGTGGTLMGVGRAIRAAGLSAEVVAVEPDESAVISGDVPGDHGIQGLADGFIPDVVNVEEIDEVVRVKTEEAKAMARRISLEEGFLVGISSGANIIGAIKTARRLGPGRRIITVLPDRGERYLTTFSE